MMLERAEQLVALDRLLAGVADGRGGVAMLRGPAGIGKTTLVRAAVASAWDRDIRVLSAAGTELQQEVAYGLVRRLLRPLLREMDDAQRSAMLSGQSELALSALGLAPPPGPEVDAGEVAAAIAWLVADLSERSPLVVAVDDLQWADRGSVAALVAMAADAAQLPIGLLLATRPDGGIARQLDGVLRNPAATVLTLPPLTRAATAMLVEQTLVGRPASGFVDACVEVTGGVPLLVGECLAVLRSEGRPPDQETATLVRRLAPEAITRMVVLRLARLSDDARAVARAVAVLGDGLDSRHAAAVADRSLSDASHAADELAEAGIFDHGRPLAFAHPMLRSAVAEDIAPAKWAAAHARAADVLADDGAGTQAIAAHLLLTEPAGDARTVERLHAAADDALSVGAAEEAAGYLRRALAEPPMATDRWRTAHALGAAGLLVGASDALDHLTAAAEAAPAGRPAAVSALDVGRSLAMANRHVEAVDWIDRAIAEAHGEAGDPDLALRLQAQWLWTAFQSEELGAAYTTRLSTLPKDLPGGTVAEQLVLCYHAHSACLAPRPYTEALALARRALAGDRVVGLGLEGGLPASFAIGALCACDRFEEAQAALAAAAAASRRVGASIALPMFACQRAYVHLRAGELAQAGDAIVEAEEAFRRQGPEHLGHEWAKALRLTLMVEGGSAEEALAVAPDGPIAVASSFSAELLTARGRARMLAGDLEGALEDLEAVERQAQVRGHGDMADEVVFRPHLAILRRRLGDEAAARRTAEGFLSEARRFGAPGLLGEAVRAAALAGPDEARVRGLEEAAELLEPSPRRLLLARTLVDLGAVLRRAGRRVDGRARLREGMDIAQRCGAEGLAQEAAGELRASGGRLRRSVLSGVDALTPSERRVADLAAAGLTNRQISRELYLTVGTVEMHLSATFRKLDLCSRTQLADALNG